MIKAINYASNTTFKGNETKTEAKQEKTPEQIKNGKKKLAIGLAAAATVAAAGIAIAAKVKNGKTASINLSDIKFDKGIASLNGEKFTGTVSDTLANGDKISLTYEDGKIAQSVRQGSKNITKKFNYMQDAIKPSSVETLSPKGEIINKATFEYDTYGKVGHFEDKNRTLISDAYGQKTVHVNKQTFSNDGSISYVADENNFKTYSKDNKLTEETLPDGTKKYWHDNGQLSKETLPDGTRRSWNRNGQLHEEAFPNGAEKKWYDNGRLSKEILPDGTKKEWHSNGLLAREILPDKTQRAWYRNGQLAVEELPNKPGKYWIADGQPTSEKRFSYICIY